MNKKFGNVISDNLKYAPDQLEIGGVVYSKPTDKQYLSQGYKYVVDVRPEEKEGYYIIQTGYTQTSDTITVNYDYQEIPESTFNVSKLKLRVALMKLGFWNDAVEWMKNYDIVIDEAGDTINCYDAYNEALVINTGDAMFKPTLEKVKETFKDKISSEQIDELLKECEAE